MKKNNKNKSNNNFPFSGEIKQSKYEFKKMIDEMPDEEFIHFIMLFFDFIEELEFFGDEDLEDNIYEDADYEDLPF